MAALAAGGLVATAASLAVILGGHATRPKLGVCEFPGPLPAIIDWEDGTRTSYAAVGATTTSVIYQVLPPTNPSIVGFVVSTGADPGSRVQGVVVDHFDTLDPAGGAAPELVVVKTPIGYVVAAYSQATVLPSA